MSTETHRQEAWLPREELESVRGRVPMLYVVAVPVRVDQSGEITSVDPAPLVDPTSSSPAGGEETSPQGDTTQGENS